MIYTYPDAEQVCRAVAQEIVRLVRLTPRSRPFRIALAGGSTPRRLYQLLAAEPYRRHLPWDRMAFYFGDERCVPPDHADSNYRMAREALLDAIPGAKVRPLPANEADLEAAAARYQRELAADLGVPADGPPPRFDLVLLGMGADGHTASLFPHTAALRHLDPARSPWVVVNPVAQMNTRRLTLTAPALNNAANVIFLVCGADKTARLAEVLEGPRDPDRLPSQLIRPTNGRLLWYTDRAASAQLAKVPPKLAPSILAADFLRLGEDVRQAVAHGADRIHVDVMDGHFVPNISIGLPVVKSLRPGTNVPLETHLMISDPDRYLEAFAEAGSDSLLVHVEGAVHLHRTVQKIRSLGRRVGVVLNPATPVGTIEEILPEVDLVLVMTVNPGFGGQEFIPGMLSKIRRVRELIELVNPSAELEIDGGVDARTIGPARAAGADVFVAGSAVFGADIAGAMGRLCAGASRS